MSIDPEMKGAVTVAYVHENEVTYAWHHSLIELIAFDMNHHGRLMRGGWVAMRCGTDGLVDARNKGVKAFLEDRDAEWLLWLDTDAGFGPDLLERLVAAADPVERPVVGALAFAYREETSDTMGGWHCRPTPTVYDWHKLNDQYGFMVRWGYPENALVRCAGTGSHAILIHRTVLERVQEKYGEEWYSRIDNPTVGRRVSEDLSFCMRVNTLGIPIHVHTGIRSTHQKTTWVSERDYFGSTDAPPATERVAVIVPGIRADNAQRFMESLTASTGLAAVYAICRPEERIQSDIWEGLGAKIILSSAMTFAERVNVGYARTTEPWVFIVGDDVQFRKGWLDQAEAVAHEHKLHVVGTNDLGNPRVVRGEHATHILLRRSYIDDEGASWDGPGILAHEGYRHWYVDDEIVMAAKDRGVWGMAIDSHVEHLHPQWGKGQMDDLYLEGVKHAADDLILFNARRDANAHGSR